MFNNLDRTSQKNEQNGMKDYSNFDIGQLDNKFVQQVSPLSQ